MAWFPRIGEFFEAPNGRFDLKQVAGYQSICVLCYVAVMGIPASAPLVWSLSLFGLLWTVSDIQQAINVIKAAAGGFRVPDVLNKVEGDLNAPVTGDQPTVVQTPSPAPETPTQTPTTSTQD